MKTAITNARVFDGHQLHEPDTVVIDGEHLGTDTGAEIVDAGGGALLPGLIIANGQRADLLLTDGNPLKDPDTARNPAAVWVAGKRTM